MARKARTAGTGAADFHARVIAAAMRVAARDGWSGVDIAAVARAAKLPQADVRRLYPDAAALLLGVGDLVDGQVLAGLDPELADEPPRDRLLETLMLRFDCLAPYRAGLRAASRDALRDPMLAMLLGGHLLRSMGRMLDAAAIPGAGVTRLVQTKGLTALWLYVARVWLDDESPDSGATMAALDKALDRAVSLARAMGLGGRG